MWHFSKWFVSGLVPSPSLPRRAETDWAGQVVHDILLKTFSVSKRPRGHQTLPSCSHGPLLPACQLMPDQHRPSPTRPCGWVWEREREAYISLPTARCVGAASGWGQASCEACREGKWTWFGWSLNSPRPNEKKMASEVGWTVFTQDFVGFGMEKERYSERKESERSSKTWPLTALGS